MTLGPALYLNNLIRKTKCRTTLTSVFETLLLSVKPAFPASISVLQDRQGCSTTHCAGTGTFRIGTESEIYRDIIHPSSSDKVPSPHLPPPGLTSRHGAHCFVIAMSLRSLPRASLALRSSRGGVVSKSVTVGRLTQQRWASDDKKGGDGEKPFHMQLQESIYERVQKEKAEQIRIQSLQQRTARGQFWATVTGILALSNSGMSRVRKRIY
jgi:hypothetical protein